MKQALEVNRVACLYRGACCGVTVPFKQDKLPIIGNFRVVTFILDPGALLAFPAETTSAISRAHSPSRCGAGMAGAVGSLNFHKVT